MAGTKMALDHVLGGGEVGDVVVVRDRLAAGRNDLVHHRLGRCRVRALAGERAAQVVDDDLRAGLGQGQSVLAADPPARAGDQRNLSVQ